MSGLRCCENDGVQLNFSCFTFIYIYTYIIGVFLFISSKARIIVVLCSLFFSSSFILSFISVKTLCVHLSVNNTNNILHILFYLNLTVNVYIFDK